jgi:hypothetical protein
VVKQATFAEAGAAGRAAEFVAVANVIAALAAFYGSIDELKHPNVLRIALQADLMPTDAA